MNTELRRCVQGTATVHRYFCSVCCNRVFRNRQQI